MSDTGTVVKLPTYNIVTSEGRRRIRNKLKALEDHTKAGYKLTKGETKEFTELQALLAKYNKQTEDKKKEDLLAQAAALAQKLEAAKLDAESKQSASGQATTPVGSTRSSSPSPAQSREPSTGATPRTDGTPSGSPPSTPSTPPSSSSDDDSEDDMAPRRPSGQEIASIPLFG